MPSTATTLACEVQLLIHCRIAEVVVVVVVSLYPTSLSTGALSWYCKVGLDMMDLELKGGAPNSSVFLFNF